MIDDLDSAESWLRMLIDLGPELTRSGITAITIGDKQVTFSHVEPRITYAGSEDIDRPREREESSDPLYDSSTYAGGVVPGYRINSDTDEESDE